MTVIISSHHRSSAQLVLCAVPLNKDKINNMNKKPILDEIRYEHLKSWREQTNERFTCTVSFNHFRENKDEVHIEICNNGYQSTITTVTPEGAKVLMDRLADFLKLNNK